MSDSPPDVPVQPARRSFLQRASVVWIIPIVALVIALAVAWQSYAERGPLIEISFENASGVAVGQTELRYRDVAVGLVETMAFTETLDRVLVGVRLDKSVADFVDDGAQFYVVRPEISAQGISGLETVLSGVYIHGVWDTEPQGLQKRHDGSDDAPLSPAGQKGLTLRLRAAADATLTEKAPIVYQGLEVGRIGNATITEDGNAVEADAIIYAPHDRLISTATRFWDASGFSFSLGPGGATIDFSSVASLVSGGVTFRTVVSGGEPAKDGDSFLVYPDEGVARSSLFSEEEGRSLDLTAVFSDNVSGLAVDAPVDLGGVRVGRVTSLNGIVDKARFGDNRVRLAATLSIRPGRLGLEGEAGKQDALDFLKERVLEGMRARLATASILTGGLKVELVMIDGRTEPGVTLDTTREPNPMIPTTESDIADVTATAEGVFERINALPIEELLNSAIGLMDNLSRLSGSPDIRAIPADVRATIADLQAAVQEARNVIGSEDIQALPGRVAAVVAELQTLVAQLNEEDAAGRVLAAVDAARDAANGVSEATVGLPELIASIDEVSRKAQALPLEDMTSEITGLAADVRTFVTSDSTQALPAALVASLAEVDALLSDAREKGVTESLVSALDSTRIAATDVSAAFDEVPALIDRLNAIAAKAETVPLDQLSVDLSELMTSATAILDTQGARELPENLGDALQELRRVLTELREGGVVANVNATFDSARVAADTLADVARRLPAVLDQVRTVLTRTSGTIAGYDANSGIGRDLASALREVQRAAGAVSALARALERNPNSLLFGR
ncbi:MlaD family protein [Pseudooceanicola sp.]|uniref:MlaD family protein n=1 Tax=Pseudooceanicola sp. TaxID=1914328 RepID=UPI000C091CFC|nr:paraquat-inducible protein B [Pseudooceanicola sp.]